MTVSGVGSSTADLQALQGAHARRPPISPSGIQAAAKALGLDADDVATKLQSGSTLADLAKAQGVEESSVVSAIAQDMKAHRPQGAVAVSDDQLTAMATNVVEGKHRGHHHHHADAAEQADSAPNTSSLSPGDQLNSLADTLGVDANDLLSQLLSGDRDAIAGASSGYGSSPSQQGLLVDQRA